MQVKRAGANRVSGGAVLAANPVGAKGANVQALWRGCLAIVGAVTAAGSVKAGVGT